MLAGDEIAVWYCRTESLTAEDLQHFETILDAGERKRSDRFVFARDRRDFASAHALLRSVLSRYAATAPADWRFEAAPQGKPSIAPEQAGVPRLSFNLSHTHGFVACAVTRGAELGIDVERRSRVTGAPEIAERYFAGPELVELAACTADKFPTRFIELWTLKESYLKGTGIGLGLPLDSFAFTFEGDSGLRFGPDERTDWQFWLASWSTDVRIAVAVRSESPGRRWQISFNEWPTETSSMPMLLRWLRA